ncbi:MAG: dynamin family protein [Paludibacteraceae bacterium]|nr:dynamin family protein [Paludibacteraceae bacterium]
MGKINENNAFEKAKELLCLLNLDGKTTNFDFSDCIEKLEKIISSKNDKDIKIVLLGSFSDGKTSTVAGMMEEVLDNMNIDTDESSDQLVIYRPKDLKSGFTIIDTPGLFGTKEKEIDGDLVKFSEITKKFISEAHIVLYVTSAQVPVKESHSAILRKVLRDLGKLDSTIFVLNKMDETGVNITNEEAYQEMCGIKKNFLIERLRNIIGLSDQEIGRLKIVCVCSDPKAKGIQKWLETPERYRQLSRLPQLKQILNNIVDNSNREQLQNKSYLSSVNDVVGQISIIYKDVDRIERSFQHFKEEFEESSSNLKFVESDLKRTKNMMREQIRSLHNSLMNKVKSASYEEMDTILNNDIGVEGEKITFYLVEDSVNGICDSCSLNNESTLSPVWKEMKNKFEKQDDTINTIANGGIKAMKKVDSKMVLQARDLLFKSFKFKPWGATKLANGIGKAAVVLQGALMALDYWGQKKREKQLNETKSALTESLNEYFAAVTNMMKDDDTYYKNFAPAYLDMRNEIDFRRKKCEENAMQMENIKKFQNKMTSFYGQNIEDVAFEEV